MRKYFSLIKVFSLAVFLASGMILCGRSGEVDAAPKNKTVISPAIFAPATVLPHERIRVSVFNDDPLLEVSYEIKVIDVIDGTVVEKATVGPVSPKTGIVVNHDPHGDRADRTSIVIIRGLVDPDGDGLSDDHPVSISSVEVIDWTTNIIRFVPVNSHTYGSGTGAHWRNKQ